MKIIHIVENLDNRYGGPAKSVPLLVKYLDKLNIENVIITIKEYENESNYILNEYDYNIKRVKPFKIKKIRYSKKLKNIIENEITNDAIIHLHAIWTYPIYIGYKIAKKYNVPFIVTTRGMLYTWCLKQNKIIKQIAMKLYVRDMLTEANFIHITEKNEKLALENININSKFILIPNGIELEKKYNKLDEDILKLIDYDINKKYIMFLGRIVHNKGLHYLISSYKKLQNKYDNIRILVVGGIEEQSYFDSLDKMKSIYFLGQLDGIEKHTVFKISNLFVLPTKSENFGISIAEAMSYRLPIITTTGTPWKEIKEKNAGWWIELNQKNLNKTIEEAIQCNENELIIKGNNAFNIIKHYTWDKQALKMKQNYKKILKKGK